MIVTMCNCNLLSYVDCHILGRCKNINYTIQQNNVWYGNNLFDIPRYTIRHGIFPFFNGNPFFSELFGSFLRSMQIRFNNFRGGGGHATLQQIYRLSILPLCDFYWLQSTVNIAICDASLLLSPSISTADLHETSDMPV